MFIHVCTLSPSCCSDIDIHFQLSRITLAKNGKQLPEGGGRGGGGEQVQHS